MRYHVLAFCVFVVTIAKAQLTLKGCWPVMSPITYVNFLGEDSIRLDTTSIWDDYMQNGAHAIISDTSNKMLFQTNGCRIADKLGSIIENGDSLIDNEMYDVYGYVGLTITQGAIAFPRDADTWWVFTKSFSDTGFTTANTQSPDRLYAAIVDVTAKNGAGKVTAKKIPVHKGILGDCRMTACRHANGRDWWLVNHGWNDSVLCKWLVTPDSIYGVYRDTVTTLQKEVDWYGMAKFTQDGTKYAVGSGNGLVALHDFDRCTGVFTNLRTINFYNEPPSVVSIFSPVFGLEFSASGRYLYLSAVHYLCQYDTWATDVASTRTLIAKYDSTYSNPEPLFTMALTPQDEIFICNKQGFGNSPMHIIHEPDSGGTACNFEKEALAIPNSYNNTYLPNLANLKLGADTTSLCDTIIQSVGRGSPFGGQGAVVRVFPNPATEVVFIEVENNRYFSGTLTIVNQLGQTVYENKKYDGATAIKVSGWPAGVYYYHLKNKGHEQSGKVVVERQ